MEHDTREIMETGLLILNEAVKGTYEDDGMPMLSWNRVYGATQEDEALTRLLEIIQRGMSNPSSPTTTPQTPKSLPTVPPAQSSTPPSLTPPSAGNINMLPEMATVADTAPMVDHYSGPTDSVA